MYLAVSPTQAPTTLEWIQLGVSIVVPVISAIGAFMALKWQMEHERKQIFHPHADRLNSETLLLVLRVVDVLHDFQFVVYGQTAKDPEFEHDRGEKARLAFNAFMPRASCLLSEKLLNAILHVHTTYIQVREQIVQDLEQGKQPDGAPRRQFDLALRDFTVAARSEIRVEELNAAALQALSEFRVPFGRRA
jgi:hypothetical protein